MANFGERYELVRRIGSGGMGEVWLAHDEQLASRPVAIKIMHQRMLPNEGDLARFEREMRFAAMMDHPNIVTLYTTGTYDDAPFMVMEYLRGQDLQKALPHEDAEHIAGIGRDICSALEYAHDKGVLHRDIKPSNLFLCESGQVKVTDFGVARAVSGTTITTSGFIVGTFAYLPPERWRGEPPAFGNDIWAVGCVLYQLIAGRLPRVQPDVAGYAAAALRDEPIPHVRDISDAPSWLATPVMAMLAADPASRPSAGDCVRMLSGLQSPAPVPGRLVFGWPFPAQPDPGLPELGPVIGAASEEPAVTTGSVPRLPAERTTPGRWRRPGPVASAAGGVVLLLLAGSIIAWQLSTSPHASGTATPSALTTVPALASHSAAAKTPAATGSAPRSGAAAGLPPSSSASGSPVSSGAADPASSHSVSPPSSRPAPAAGSRSASPESSTTASPAVSATASAAPAVVPVPDVVGLNLAKAARVLQNAGFTVVVKRTGKGRAVTSASPSGEAPAGSTITVEY